MHYRLHKLPIVFFLTAAWPLFAAEDHKPTLFLTYAITGFSLPLPWKHGPEIGVDVRPDVQVAGRYLSQEARIGIPRFKVISMREENMGLRARWFFTPSFYFLGGVASDRYTLDLGAVRFISGVFKTPRFNVITIEKDLLDLGIGHFWRFENGATVEANWYTLRIPISKSRISGRGLDLLADDSWREATLRTVDRLERLPSFYFLTLAVGWTI